MTVQEAITALIEEYHLEEFEQVYRDEAKQDNDFIGLSGRHPRVTRFREVCATLQAFEASPESRPAPPPQVGSKLEEPLQELADLEAEMRTYVCWGQPKVSVWLERLAVIREALT